MKSTVSVVIPTWNRAHTITRALRSVMSQSHPPDEIIVVDDGSTDDTGALLDRQFADCTVIRQARAGVSAARNAGIQRASGTWIALLDSDDAWHPDKLARQLDHATPVPGSRLVHCNERWLRRGQPLAQKAYHAKRGGDIFEDCLRRCVISPSAALLHRSVFADYGLFDETLPACEDYDLWLRVTACEPVAFVPEVLVTKHGGHPDQLSHTVATLDAYRIRALAKLLTATALDPSRVAAARDELVRKRDIFLNGARKHGNVDDAKTLAAICKRALERSGTAIPTG